MNWKSLFKTYLEDQSLSLNTIKTYLSHVENFIRFKGLSHGLFSLGDLEDYFTYLNTSVHEKSRAIPQIFSALKKYNHCLIDNGYMSKCLLHRGMLKAMPIKTHFHVQSPQVPPLGKTRNQLLEILRNQTQIPVNDLLAIKLAAIQLNQDKPNSLSSIVVLTMARDEGTQDLYLYLDHNTSLLLKQYLIERALSAYAKDSPFLFVSQKSGRLSPSGLYRSL